MDYSLDDFRAEMRKRGVYGRWTPRIGRAHERRQRREGRQTYAAFLIRTLSAVRSRIVELSQCSPDEVVVCPWSRVEDAPRCDVGCKCSGRQAIGVKTLLAHYCGIAAEIEEQL
jgi:hypothetical protein